MKNMYLYLRYIIATTFITFIGPVFANSYDGRMDITEKQMRYAITGVRDLEFTVSNTLVPIVMALLLTGIFYATKYVLNMPEKKQGIRMLEEYKEKLESMIIESDFMDRRRKYYVWRINKFIENGQWVNMKTGMHEKISPSLVEGFIAYHDRRIKQVNADEILYRAELKKIKKKDFIVFQEISREMDNKILQNDYDGYNIQFYKLIANGRIFIDTKLNKIDIQESIADLSERFFYTKEIHKILTDSESFYVDGMREIYSKKMFDQKRH